MEIKSVTIMGLKYKVTTKTPKEIPKEHESAYYGHCDREENLIWVNKRLNGEHKMRTLFHEMGHATFFRSGVSFAGIIPSEIEEILVEVFATQQYEFLKSAMERLIKYEDTELRDRLSTFLIGEGVL